MLVEPPEIVTIDRDHLVATWRDVLVVNWRVEVTMHAVRRLRSVLGEFAAARPAGIATFVVLDAGALVPGHEPRNETASVLRQFEAHTLASCVVIDGQGFRAAAFRSVIAGLSLITRVPYPHRVFGTIDAASDWLASCCGTRLSRPFVGAELDRAVKSMRSGLAMAHAAGA
jgi:hypothetical protein